jgi:hypothetical protein
MVRIKKRRKEEHEAEVVDPFCDCNSEMLIVRLWVRLEKTVHHMNS